MKNKDIVVKPGQDWQVYKLFDIDWNEDDGPILADKCWPSAGRRYGRYRIFGFTDRPEVAGNLNAELDVFYDKQPCDHTGNRKYAIGRLEK